MLSTIKRILVFILISISGKGIVAQQPEVCKDVFFNPKMINPAYLTDSAKLDIDFIIHWNWLKRDIDINGLNISAEKFFKTINSSLGLNVESFVNNWYFISGYKYKWTLNYNSAIDFGINLGLRMNKEDIYFSDISQTIVEPDWKSSFYTNIGTICHYKNQVLGFSYNFTETQDKKRFVMNYQGIYNISQNFKLIPELYGCFNKQEKYGIIIAKMKYSGITVGLLYNSKKNMGFLFSGIINNQLKLGFYFSQSVFNSNTYLSEYKYSGFNLGLIL